MDDVLTSHNDPPKKGNCTKNVGELQKAGVFFLEPSVKQGKVGDKARKSGRETKSEVLVLPNRMNEDDNKALGLR